MSAYIPHPDQSRGLTRRIFLAPANRAGVSAERSWTRRRVVEYLRETSKKSGTTAVLVTLTRSVTERLTRSVTAGA
eukprot:379222-Prorocentrum_minimum.AAC.1